ncbi:hypothetical protein [Actinoplanes sp. DH11]|uniref:hypothetical protein n=1 Tax=Actinoplanes sp. DH11 TaxID=2857011 RepID=UPI001E294EFD|nr:hypothetical protein [Actinoplanes sp. DH11]
MTTIRVTYLAYAALAATLAADGRPALAVPLCLTALLCSGELLLRALPGIPAESGVPAARAGLTALAGLATLPLVALTLHLAGAPIRTVPLLAGTTAAVTLSTACALWRENRPTQPTANAGADARPVAHADAEPSSPGRLPAQRARGLLPPDDPASDQARAPESRAASDHAPVLESPAASDHGPLLESQAVSDHALAPEHSASLGRAPVPGPPAISVHNASTNVKTPDAVSGLPVNPDRGMHVVSPESPAGKVRVRLGEYARNGMAVAAPVVLAVAIGAVATRAYLSAPRPEQPGYLSVALNGWAAGIDKPVTVPVRGLAVPVRVTSAGLDTLTTSLRLRIGGRLVAARPVTVGADTVRSLTVHVPAMPADGCLRAVSISVGRMSTGFYARGPITDGKRAALLTAGKRRAPLADEHGAPLTEKGQAAPRLNGSLTGPGVGPATPAGSAAGAGTPAGVRGGSGAGASAGAGLVAGVVAGGRGRPGC